MNLADITLLAVGLAMDCLTVSMVSGVTEHDARNGSRLWLWRMALLFGLFQAFMPLLGWLGMAYFQTFVAEYNRWISFSLLVFIGGRMVYESFGTDDEKHFNPHRLTTQLMLAVATSIDAMAVGVLFACTGYHIVWQLAQPLAIIAIVSFLFSIAGYHLGHCFGRAITKRMKPELLGGLILIAIGVKILVT